MLIKVRKDIRDKKDDWEVLYVRIFKSFFFILKETCLNEFNKKTKWLDNDLFISLKLAQVVIETIYDMRITYVDILQIITKQRFWILSSIEDTIVSCPRNDRVLWFDSFWITIKNGNVEWVYYKKKIKVGTDNTKYSYPKLNLSIFDIINTGKIAKDRLSQWFNQVEKYLVQIYEDQIIKLKFFIKWKYSIPHLNKKYYSMDILLAHHDWVIKQYETVQKFFDIYLLLDEKRQKRNWRFFWEIKNYKE
jgi:hypothetical protein